MEQFIGNAPMIVVVLLLLAGFVLLIKGADFFVEGSSSIAKRFNVPSVVIGLTVVAMGTSLPETAVSVTASMANNNALAVSNAIGSNIFNLMVVIGFCAVLTPVAVGMETIKRDIPFTLICTLMLLGLGICGLGDKSTMVLGHIDGAIFLVVFVAYLVLLVRSVLKDRKNNTQVVASEDEEIKLVPVPLSIVFVILGGAAIAFGGNLTVESASRIATELGMSQTLVGLTVCSIGTSLPELVTSIVAAKKNEVGMALGNAIGSNIFNILMVLGIASAISPIAFIMDNVIDIAILLVFTVIVWAFAATKKSVEKKEGIIMLLLYVAYTAYIFIRCYL